MKLLITTQIQENYGAHDWDGVGACPQYWKFKGGSDYSYALGPVMRSTIVLAEIVEHFRAQIECNNEGFREYIIGFDGSWKNDSTSVVVVILPREENDVYRVFRANSGEKDFMLDDDSWVVDKQAVANWVIDFFHANPGCRELAADPTYWPEFRIQCINLCEWR